MKIVIVSGVDGSGKSTQLALLGRYLRSRGFKVKYLWLRWFAAFTFLLYVYAKLTRRTIVIRTRTRPIHVHIFWIDPLLRYSYPRLLLFDLILWFILNKLIARIKGCDVLLIDRFVLDVLVDLLWEVRDIKFLKSTLVRNMWGYVKSTVVLTVKPREAIKRKSDIISLREAAFKKRCFEMLAKYLDIPILDTTGADTTTTFRELIELLKLHIRY